MWPQQQSLGCCDRRVQLTVPALLAVACWPSSPCVTKGRKHCTIDSYLISLPLLVHSQPSGLLGFPAHAVNTLPLAAVSRIPLCTHRSTDQPSQGYKLQVSTYQTEIHAAGEQVQPLGLWFAAGLPLRPVPRGRAQSPDHSVAARQVCTWG